MKLGFPLLVVLAVLGVAGCQKGNFSEQASAGKENTFRYPIFDKPTTLDPALVQDGDTIDILQNVYEGLTAWSTDNKPVPNLAEKWVISPDGTVYTFTLRKGVKFHSGREVKAADVKFSYERACDPSFTQGMADNYLSDIVGVKDRLAKKAKDVKGIEVVDDYTIRITIDKPRPYFLGKLTYPVSYVVDKDKVPTKADGSPAEITTVEAMDGTGPFKASKYVEDQLFVMTANKDYHGGAPKLDTIERPVVKDAATRLNKFRSGELDYVMLQRGDVKGVQGDAKLKDQLQFSLRPSIYYVAFNGKVYPPFADVRVRRAFAMAVDRDKICKDFLGGVNQKADTIIPPGVIGYRETGGKVIPYDPAGAKKLLAQAGFADGSKMPPLTIYFRDSQPDVRLVAEAVQNMIKTNLGVSVTPKMMQWKAYLEMNKKKLQPFYHMRWGADYLDPQNFLSLLLSSTGPENNCGYSNPKFDDLCARADVMSDQTERMKLYQEAEDIALQDAAWIPVYFQRDAELISPKVSGLRESLFGILPHTETMLKK